jgi:hypothetical protein
MNINAYTVIAMDTLLNGNGIVPGIFETDYSGVPGIMAFYSVIGAGAVNYVFLADNSTLLPYCAYYNTTLNQLATFFFYINDYLLPTINPWVPTLIGINAGFAIPACTSATAYDYIKLQWGTAVLLPIGLGSLNPAAVGFEVNTTLFTNFAQILGLWDPNNATSLVNEDGIELWVNATHGSEDAIDALTAGTGFSDELIDVIIEWYDGSFEDVVKYNAGVELGVITDDIMYLRLLLLQWERMLLSSEPVEFEGVTGVEVNLPEKDWLTEETRLNLWNDSFSYSLTTEEGMAIWLKAAKGNDEAIEELKENVALTDSQISGTGVWILHMRDDVLPEIAVKTGVISPGVKFIIDSLKSSGIYLGIIGIVVLVAIGYNKYH